MLLLLLLFNEGIKGFDNCLIVIFDDFGIDDDEWLLSLLLSIWLLFAMIWEVDCCFDDVVVVLGEEEEEDEEASCGEEPGTVGIVFLLLLINHTQQW